MPVQRVCCPRREQDERRTRALTLGEENVLTLWSPSASGHFWSRMFFRDRALLFLLIASRTPLDFL